MCGEETRLDTVIKLAEEDSEQAKVNQAWQIRQAYHEFLDVDFRESDSIAEYLKSKSLKAILDDEQSDIVKYYRSAKLTPERRKELNRFFKQKVFPKSGF